MVCTQNPPRLPKISDATPLVTFSAVQQRGRFSRRRMLAECARRRMRRAPRGGKAEATASALHMGLWVQNLDAVHAIFGQERGCGAVESYEPAGFAGA